MISTQPKDDFSKDFICSPSDSPTDSISCFSWTRSSTAFACASWDSTVRLFSFQEGVPCFKLEKKFELPDPCLSLDFAREFVLGGCIDGTIKIFDPVGSRVISMEENPEHQDAVKSVHWLEQEQMYVSLSYDKTMKFWDLRQKSSIKTEKLEAKPFCSDKHFQEKVIAVGFDDGRVGVLDLDEQQSLMSLKWNFIPQPFHNVEKITDISMFGAWGALGFGVASDWGRGGLYELTRSRDGGGLQEKKIMVFKAHKQWLQQPQKELLYPMNAIGMHQSSKNLFTAGGEGNIYLWNYEQKHKTGTISLGGTPVTKAKFNPDCSLILYANGYDYAKGIEGAYSYNTRIGVHKVKPEELRAQN